MCNFKENIAVHYGINAAIVAQFIWDSLKKNNYDGKVYEKEGRKWCRCSMLCGFCMKKILEELEERKEAKEIDDCQDDFKGTE